jgi:hypothetical protein
MLERRPNLQSASLSSRTAGKYASKVLLPEQIAQSDGIGSRIDVGPDQGNLLVLTLSIDQMVEKEGLVVSVWGSSDGRDWGSKSLLTLPQKYYCGMYSALLNLAKYPAVRYLRVEWTMRRWGKGDPVPEFGFSVFTERSGARVSAAVA